MEDNMTQRVKRLAAVVGATVLTVGLAGAGYVSAQNSGAGAPAGRQGGGFGPGRGRGGPGGPGGILGPAFQRLDLSDAQKARVKEILDSHQNDLRALGARVMTAREAVETATTADTFDEATVRTKAAEAAAVDADMAVMRARVYTEVYQILTPDQQKQLKQVRAEMQQHMQERGAHRGQK
jgi:Spy/CpxP family protein refolding chaperone